MSLLCFLPTPEKFWQMSSFPEKRVLNMSEDDDALRFVKQNERCLAKVYPYGLRFYSSNMEPLVPWLCGAPIGKLACCCLSRVSARVLTQQTSPSLAPSAGIIPQV